MRVLSVGVIGYGVVGKRRIQHILDNKNLKLKYVSDIEFKKNFTKKKVNYFINYLDLIKKTYQNLDAKVKAARQVVGKPLTLAEKILYSHLWDGSASTAFARSTD